jgi:hypothetical protein
MAALQRKRELFVDLPTLLALLRLLSFENKAAFLVEIDAAGRCRTVIVAESDCPLEHIVISLGFTAGRIGSAHTNEIAELDEE